MKVAVDNIGNLKENRKQALKVLELQRNKR